jgi:hypothetical protein
MMATVVTLWILFLVARVARLRSDVWHHAAPGSGELGPIDAATISEVYARLYHPPPAPITDEPVRRPSGPSHPNDEAPVRLEHAFVMLPGVAPGPPMGLKSA